MEVLRFSCGGFGYRTFLFLRVILLYSCTFIGHSDCTPEIKVRLYSSIERLIKEYNVTTFYVGTHGKFDYYAYIILCELEKNYDINILVVLAYLNNIPDYFDRTKTVFPESVEKAPPKYAIIRRNYYMIEKSQFMICYIDDNFSNSYKFIKNAVSKKINIINLGKFDLNKI